MRMMHAIMNGGKGKPARGGTGPDKGTAAKYSGSEPGTESKGKEMEGGRHPTGSGRAHHGIRGKDAKEARKKKDNIKKSEAPFGAGTIVVCNEGKILLGKQKDGKWATFGGGVERYEDYHEAAIRELKEEIGLTAEKIYEITPEEGHANTKSFVCEQWSGKPKVDNKEFKSFKWFDTNEIPWSTLRECCYAPLKHFVSKQLAKSTKLADMLLLEDLKKNIVRSEAGSDVVHDSTHGDSLKLIGNGVFRMLRNATKDMTDEDFREMKVDTYTLKIRKHVNDVYSGRILDGNKQIHQFTNKSLPSVSVELMSVFEWYLPEDAQELELVDDLHDDDINGGMQNLIDDYYRHNVTNIYSEMEHIRGELRQSHAVDLQQVEQKIMKLFDKLESTMLHHADKHNDFTSEAGKHIDEVHEKLRELQCKIDELGKKPTQIEAVSKDPTTPENPAKVHEEGYMYISRPQIEIEPGGRMKILFKSDWSSMERTNFLKDMKARVVKNEKL
jgi:8-oxo-dGTP pyrophosphatase MutT (NUDIX family)